MMFQQIVNKWRQILPHGILEQTGVLLWVISVMVIGLRLTLIVPDQPIFLHMLQLSVTTLATVGMLGALLSLILLGMNLLHAPVQSSAASMRRHASASIWWSKRSRLVPPLGSLVLLTFDSLLAATIVRTAISWAEQSRLDGLQIVYLVGLAALHISLTVLHEHAYHR